jgi:hypothetical protein
MRCARCGHNSLVPTSLGLMDDLRSLFGLVRFRCVRCNQRELKRLWPVSDVKYAHCPRCFSGYLQRWSPMLMGSSAVASMKRLLGGRSHRCLECSHAFTSWRRVNPRYRYDGQAERLAGLAPSSTPSVDLPVEGEALSSATAHVDPTRG